MDLISIIIPTYKREEFFERALKSLINQTYKNIEILIIDDNSEFLEIRNRVKTIVEKYNSDLRIKYIQNFKNLGGAFSRNEGIKQAKGKYVAFLDDDDEYELDKIEKQYYFYKEKFHKDQGILYSQEVSYDNRNNKISSSKTYVNSNKIALYFQMIGNIATTGNWFIPKKILEEVEAFEKLDCGQEWYLILKILLKGYECTYMKDELLKYYEHEEERITTNYQKKYYGELKLYEIKKENLWRFTEEEKNTINYKVNIMLANYALKVSKKRAIQHLFNAKQYQNLKIKDICQLFLKLCLNEKCYNGIKKLVS